jgi:hypothetical protein
MRSSQSWMRYFAEWLERVIANAKVATLLCSIPASSDAVESEAVSKKVLKNQKKNCFVGYSTWVMLLALRKRVRTRLRPMKAGVSSTPSWFPSRYSIVASIGIRVGIVTWDLQSDGIILTNIGIRVGIVPMGPAVRRDHIM